MLTRSLLLQTLTLPCLRSQILLLLLRCPLRPQSLLLRQVEEEEEQLTVKLGMGELVVLILLIVSMMM